MSLALAALSQDAEPQSFIARYSGAEDAIAQYLQECVLSSLPPEVLAFMQRTSILEVLEPALCDRLVPGAGGTQMLELLKDLGLVVPAGPSRQARSYHALLKDLLRARLLRDHAATCGELHGIASRWYEERLRFDATIDHAVQGADVDRAFSLVATHAMRLLSEGLVLQLSDWLGSLPPAALAASDELMLVRCWSSCYAQGPSAAGAILAASMLPRSSDPCIAQHVIALRACMLAMLGRHEEAGRLAQAGLADFPGGESFAHGALLQTLAMAAREADPGAKFDAEITLDCSTLQPQITWGTSPQHVTSIDGSVPRLSPGDDPGTRELIQRALSYICLEPGAPLRGVPVDVAYIGSCTNARLSDLRAAASVLRGRKVAPGVLAVCVPGSIAVKAAAEAEGLDRIFRDAGFEWHTAGCGMCGNAGRGEFADKRVVSSTNRNFQGRQGPQTRTHLASPATVAASAVAGCFADPRDYLSSH